MDFFASQDLARRNTRKLIALLGLTVVCLTLAIYGLMVGVFVFLNRSNGLQADWGTWFRSVENLQLFGWVLLGVTVVVGFGSLYKISELRAGGSVVANLLGGRRLLPNTTDLGERRLLNVVEEMAIASGVPVPPVYVLDDEDGINAFAAGHTLDDCVIGVNRGTLDRLNRDELQGVIGHEFSHILNGDMRMSLRMIGLLHGILVIALIGYQIVRLVGHGSRSSSKDKKGGAAALILVGVGLIAIGSIGLLFARLIKASVSRQREYLADASSVQFTRNPAGIAGALKMIGANAQTSRVEQANAETISHMFFANMTGSLLSHAFATHPPLVPRIQKIEPQFSGDFADYQRSRSTASVRDSARKKERQGQAAGASAATSAAGRFGVASRILAGSPPAGMMFDPAVLVATIGEPTDEDVIYSRYLMGKIPDSIQDALRDVFLARCVVFAWLLDRRGDVQSAQLAFLKQSAGEPTVIHTQKLAHQLQGIDVQYRLPMSEILQGTLVGLSPPQYQTFRAQVIQLIQADQQVDLLEFFLQHHLLGHLDRHFGRGLPHPILFESLEQVAAECTRLLCVLARYGHSDNESARFAFEAAVRLLPPGWARAEYVHGDWDYPQLAHAVKQLSHAGPQAKKQFLSAAAVSITFDHQITVIEAELYRALGESLDCPVPPIMALSPESE